MAKKKSCQNVRNPRVLSPVERELHGWVDAEVFTQSYVLASEHLPELRREMRLTQDLASERDFVLEATGPSDREVLTRCQVAVSQLHLNGWGFLRTFERVCLHFGFRPSWRIFLYTYQLYAPPPGNGFLSFRAYQGRRLFDAFEESIQEFKWHYFKVLPLPGTRPFWVDDEGKTFPWSLPVGLGKRSNFQCRWILDHSDAEFTYRHGEAKQLRSLETEDGGGGWGGSSFGPSPCSVSSDRSGASASGQAVPAPAPVASTIPVPPPAAAKKKGSSRDPSGKPFSVEGEEGAKEDPSADLKKKGRKRKAPEASAEEAALGADSSWVHKVSPINRAFLDDYSFWATFDAGLTNGPTREILGPLVPEQLLGTAQHLACQLTACLQMEKELASLKDQVDLLTVERDSALAAPLLNAKIKSLTQELAVSEGKRLSALTRMQEVEEKARVQVAQLESWRSALEKEKKGAEALAKSLKEKQAALDGAEAAFAHWRDEWKSLAEETGDMVQETFEILMDQVRHLNPAIDYSMISLDTRWDPKAKRIYNPKAEAQKQSETVADEQPDPVAGVPLGEDVREDAPEVPVVKEGGECPVSNL
ncbi:hypothetical protein PIB30_083534 [Stylosanthes scabra]|uniref:Transposase (Putative), gypsy type n=1 Tax=Stylosanthes scabra TaxID=79078 RepID=A0ABU6YRC0_9FABA|nr:hypothetical protein [Stylosanthes scabra]